MAKDALGHGSNARGGGSGSSARQERVAMNQQIDARHFPPSRSQLGVVPAKAAPIVFSPFGRALVAAQLGLGAHQGAVNAIKGKL